MSGREHPAEFPAEFPVEGLSGDVEILPRLLDAAERFDQRPTVEQMAELAARREASALFV